MEGRPLKLYRIIRIVLTGLVTVAAVFLIRPTVMRRLGAGASKFHNQTPPDFPPGGTWINSDRPLNWAELRGRVVWLEFSFLG